MTRIQQSRLITLSLGDRELKALLRLPVGFDPNEFYPAIIYAHCSRCPPAESKDRRYEQLLQGAAFVSLTLDEAEQPNDQSTNVANCQSIRGAVDYLRTYPFIDPERIGVLGRGQEP